jgi:hypothetical protein
MFELNLFIFQIISKLAVLFSENFEKITTGENSIHKSPFPSLPTAILLNLNNLKQPNLTKLTYYLNSHRMSTDCFGTKRFPVAHKLKTGSRNKPSLTTLV